MASEKLKPKMVDVDYRKWVVGDPDGKEIGYVMGTSYSEAVDASRKLGFGLFVKVAEADYVHYRKLAIELAKKLHRLEKFKIRAKEALKKAMGVIHGIECKNPHCAKCEAGVPLPHSS